MVEYSTEEPVGKGEILCIGRAQSGITISTCLGRKLAQSPNDFCPGLGKLERVGQGLATTVEARDEVSSRGEREPQGTTMGT